MPAEQKLYRMTVGPIICRNQDNGELMFEQGGFTWENLEKANVEVIEGELLGVLIRLNETSKQRTAQRGSAGDR